MTTDETTDACLYCPTSQIQTEGCLVCNGGFTGKPTPYVGPDVELRADGTCAVATLDPGQLTNFGQGRVGHSSGGHISNTKRR